jgi:hypothetical protein
MGAGQASQKGVDHRIGEVTVDERRPSGTKAWAQPGATGRSGP